MAAPPRFRTAWEAIDAGVPMCAHDHPDAVDLTGRPLCPTCRTELARTTADLEAIPPPLLDIPALAAGDLTVNDDLEER
jgi:hypothetical protein